MKELFKRVRDELKKHYVPLVADELTCYRNYSGTGQGCCVWGAVCRHAPYDYSKEWEAMRKLDSIAIQMFPELRGTVKRRADSEPVKALPGASSAFANEEGEDSFDAHPAVFVNNHLGKDAILSVVRKAIRSIR